MDFASLFVGMIITAFAYLLVPVILAIRGKEVKVKRVAIINFIVVWLILTVIIIELGGENTSAGGLLWAFVGYYILKKRCSPKSEINTSKEGISSTKCESITDSKKDIKFSLSADGEKETTTGGYQIYGSDITLEPNKETHSTLFKEQIHSDDIQKEGKQVKKKYNKYILLIVVIVALLLPVVGNIVQYSNNASLKEKNKKLKAENENYEWVIEAGVEAGVIGILNAKNEKTSYIFMGEDYLEYQNFWSRNHNKVEFMDENIVFVLDGYGNYFYTYDQVQQVTQGKEYSYWLCHRDNAIRQGYTAWE